MNRHVQIVEMSTSLIDYFKMVMDFDNESQEYREITEKEFKEEIEKSLNCGVANKKIRWVNK